jgi:hypothetical protein
MLNAVESRRLSRAVWVRRIAVVATFAFGSATVTACIFDDGGDYKGGGRRGQGAEIVTGEPTDQPTSEPTDTASTGTDSGGPGTQDAGTGGG